MQPHREFSELLPKMMQLWGPRIYGEFGVTAQQFRVLQLIGREPVTVGDLSAKSNAKAPAMTRLLRRLETKGWVAKSQDPGDRRVVWLKLTEEGRAVMEQLARNREKVIEEMFDRLSPQEQQQIIQGIRLILRSLAD